jgi:hypothetical protein
MKKAAAYIFVFAYFVMFLKPVTPILSDTIAHAFYYSQHMATVHYENGKMHVHKEIMQKASAENSSSNQALIKKSQSTDEYVSRGYNLLIYLIPLVKANQIMTTSIICKTSPDITTPPPRFI